MTRKLAFVIALGIPALLFVSTVHAGMFRHPKGQPASHGNASGRDDAKGPGNDGQNNGYGLPSPRKEPACVNDCRDALRACLDTARPPVAACFEGCRTLVDAVEPACEADPASAECEAARDAAAACVDPCRELLKQAGRTCVGEGRTCVTGCPSVSNPPCVAQCAHARGDCMVAARAQVVPCMDACKPELAASRSACMGDDDDQESATTDPRVCDAAHQVVRACIQPCRDALQAAGETCRLEQETCVQACAPSPTPVPTLEASPPSAN